MISEFLTARHALMLALILAVVVAGRSLIVRSRSESSQINLDDLLLGDDNKISKAAALAIGSWCMTTWVIVYLTLTGKITPEYYGLYLVNWVAPTIVKLWKGSAAT